MFFLIPKNVTSERPIALMPTMTRWWKAQRPPELAKWQQKYRIHWGAIDGRKGRAQRTVWAMLLEMIRFKYQAVGRRSRSSSFGLGLGRGLRAGQPRCGVGLGDALQLPKEDLAGPMRVLRASEASEVRRMCGGAAPDHYGHPARVQVELFASTYCAAGRVSQTFTIK